MVKQMNLISRFEKFINRTSSGKRCKLNGSRIKRSTIENYRQTLKLLREYEVHCGQQLSITCDSSNNEQVIKKEKSYWSRFYKDFSRFLFHHKGCHDNYCGHVFKIIKCFFRYLKEEDIISMPPFYDRFHVRKEDIRIISLLPEQFSFLIMDNAFDRRLKGNMKKTKDAFVFGCTTALRFSDLMNLRVRNLEKRGKDYFLNYLSLKTATPVKIKLPFFAAEIFLRYADKKKPAMKVFPAASLFNFNKRIRKIGELAGWTNPLGKFRSRNGVLSEQRRGSRLYRFCDLLSSHVMRKTGITFLLMMGMPEYLVRKISGHAAHSPSFFRYVNFAQSYITEEIDKAHNKLFSLYRPVTSEQ